MAALRLLSQPVLPVAVAAFSCCTADTRSSVHLQRGLGLGWPSLRLGGSRGSRACSLWPALRCALAEDMAVETQGHTSTSQGNGAFLPELLTEFMVDMKCEGCVKSVRSKLEPLEGVKSVDVDLPNQVVKVLGSTSLRELATALEQSGRKARLIGQGSPEKFALSAAVSEFKGPVIYGVVRFAQVSMELARIEASFTGLRPGLHAWSINCYGDLRKGAASTGPVYNPPGSSEPLGDLGVLEAKASGEAEFLGTKPQLIVGDLIGRALVLYDDQLKSKDGIAAAVIARSAGVGENYKKLCTCDGTVIWESTSADYVPGVSVL